ncbi:MAG: NADH-quinone oxidoreductase subunit J family protein [Nitrospirota bacterium]
MILQVGFIYFASVTVLSALMVVTRRNPVHCALYMLAVFTHVAGLFVLLDAEFVAAVQVLVYAGAILVLFLFVIMLFHGDGMKDKTSFVPGWPVVAPVAIAILGLFMSILMKASFNGVQGKYTIEAVRQAGNSQTIGMALYTDYLFPFEIASIILLVAMVGAIVLAKKKID